MADPTPVVEEPTVTLPDAPEELAAPETQGKPAPVADEKPREGEVSAVTDAEREAKASGWVPQAEWRQDPKKWKPAEEFLQFRDGVLPLVQRENRSLREENRQFKERLARLESADAERGKRSDELSIETLKYERQQAAEIGDWKKAGELEERLIDAKVAAKLKTAAPAAPSADAQTNEIWTGFVAQNPWATEPKMQQILTEKLILMRQAGSPLSGAEMLEEAKDRVKHEYPERFSRPRAPAMAEAGGNNGNARGNTRTWSDLKPEAQQELEKFMAQNPGVTKAGLLKRCAEQPSEYFRR
jgi:hypothetical protein